MDYGPNLIYLCLDGSNIRSLRYYLDAKLYNYCGILPRQYKIRQILFSCYTVLIGLYWMNMGEYFVGGVVRLVKKA